MGLQVNVGAGPPGEEISIYLSPFLISQENGGTGGFGEPDLPGEELSIYLSLFLLSYETGGTGGCWEQDHPGEELSIYLHFEYPRRM